MITELEAEDLATKHVQDYVKACKCDTTEDLANALMKMLSITAHSIIVTQGQDSAVAMLDWTARHLAKPEFSAPYRKEIVQ